VTLPASPAVSGLFPLIVSITKTIKANTALYTTGIGDDLKIIGEELTFDAPTFAPVITLKSNVPGHTVIGFVRGEFIAGCNVYCSTNGGPWVKRAFDTNPPYDDYTPLAVAGTPEKRQYRLRAVMNEAEIGLYSNIVEVTVTD
jgi:hypothetical protein